MGTAQCGILQKHVPILRLIGRYTKLDLMSDFIAGMTVGLTLIPQSIAYAALADLSPEFGLNAAFIGCFVYATFGTIREVVIGPTSLMALITASYIRQLSSEAVVIFTFIAGFTQLVMSLINLGFLVSFISIPVISGFVSAVAIIILGSQLKDLMGIKLKSGTIVQNVISVANHVKETKFPDLSLGIFCIIVLLSLRSLRNINFKKRKGDKKTSIETIVWFLSTSRNALVLLLAMLLSACFEIYYNHVPYALIGKMHSSLPMFHLPPTNITVRNGTLTFIEVARNVWPGSVLVAVVSVLENVAIAKAFAKGKTIEVSQELFALSLSSLLGSCFGAMPTAGALTRSAVAKASGVRTPFASVFSGIVITLALTFLSPYFHLIPRTVLAAILICAVLFLIEWEIIMPLWRNNKKDFSIMIITLSLSLGFGVEIGLVCGIVLSILRLAWMWARPNVTLEMLSTNSGHQYTLMTPDKGLYFPSVDHIRDILVLNKYQTDVIVIDCAYLSGLDFTTCKEFCLLFKEFNEQGRKLIFLNANEKIVKLCQRIGHVTVPCYSSKAELNGSNFGFLDNTQALTNIQNGCSVLKLNVENSMDAEKENKELYPLIEKTSEVQIVKKAEEP